MERLIVDFYEGSFRPKTGECFYGAAVAGIIGALGIGLQAYGISSAPSGDLTTQQEVDIERARQRADAQFAFQRMLQPYILEQMGLEGEYSSQGFITKVKKRARTSSEQRADEIKQLAEEKTLKYLRGEGDVDPAAKRALDRDEASSEEYIARALGPDAKLSSGGREFLNEKKESRRIAESTIRRGEGTAAEAIAQGRIGNEQRQRELAAGIMRGLPSPQAFDDPTADINYERQMQAANGWAQLGGGLLRGAAGLYGASRGYSGYSGYVGRRPSPYGNPADSQGGP